MRRPLVRYWIMFAVVATAAFVSMVHLVFKAGGGVRMDLAVLIPRSMGEWQGEDALVTEGTKRLLGSDNVLIREYLPGNGDPPVLLCLIFAGGSHRIAHPPEVCYAGQGWAIAVNEERVLKFSGEPPWEKRVNYMRITRDDTMLDVVVWYSTPDFETASFFHQKWQMLFGRLFGGKRWSAMIRLSSVVDRKDPSAAMRSLARFGAELQPHLDALGRSLEGE